MKVPSFEVKRNLCTTNVHHPSPAIVDGGQKKKKEAKKKKSNTHNTTYVQVSYLHSDWDPCLLFIVRFCEGGGFCINNRANLYTLLLRSEFMSWRGRIATRLPTAFGLHCQVMNTNFLINDNIHLNQKTRWESLCGDLNPGKQRHIFSVQYVIGYII